MLRRLYFTGNDGYQNFLVFAPILRSLILDSHTKVTDWISTGSSSKKIKPFESELEPTMFDFANGKVKI